MTTLSYGRAFRVVRETQRRAALSTRLHVLGRFLSCPFLPVVAALPAAARVLDVGSGHGIFAHLAVAAGARSVVALEPDRRKMLAWAAAGGHTARVLPACGYLDCLGDGDRAGVFDVDRNGVFDVDRKGIFDVDRQGVFDAVTVIDVLYRLPAERWDALLGGLLARLRPGGALLLKEIDPERRVKGAINRLQERAADAVGLTLGDAFAYEAPAVLRARLGRLGFVGVTSRPLGRWYPHAHILYLAYRP